MSESTECLQLNLNNPVFRPQLFALPKVSQSAALSTMRKWSNMTWNQVYRDRGLTWEVSQSRMGPHGVRLYSFRIGKGFRGLAYREENWMPLLSLHSDHDSTYK